MSRPKREVPKGPLANYAETLRHLATVLEQFQPGPQPIPIVWSDGDFLRDVGNADVVRDQLRRKFFALMGKANITDKDVQLEVCEEILGRGRPQGMILESRSHMTLTEFARMTQALEDWEIIQGYAS